MSACLVAATPAVASARGCRPPKTAWNFVSAPALHPARVHVCTDKKSTVGGLVFIDPLRNQQFGKLVGQPGALIVDGAGNPVWFHRAPKGNQALDFQTDTYGAPKQRVISFWQGVIAIPPKYTKLPAGTPVKGTYYIYDQHYKLVKRINAIQSPGKGWVTDFHELVITKPTPAHPQGTAIFFATKKKAKNLRPYGGSPNGSYEDQEIQQVDLQTNALVWRWDIGQHIPLSASKAPAPKSGLWDTYHANSINLNSAGDMLVSVRNTWGIYNLKPTGSSGAKIIWKLINGKGSSYSLSKSARFGWQHAVRFDGSNQISMFDDGCCNFVSPFKYLHPARGLVLRLSKGHATVVHQVHHYNTHGVPSNGSFRTLAGGHAFVGWGQSPYYSEYSKTNALLYDAAMPRADMSYRAWKAKWVGTPTTTPGAAARKASGKVNVFASWNGATIVAKWKVFEGKTKATVTTHVGQANRHGFQTTIRVAGTKGPWYEVQAIDSHGAPIPGGTSKPVKVR